MLIQLSRDELLHALDESKKIAQKYKDEKYGFSYLNGYIQGIIRRIEYYSKQKEQYCNACTQPDACAWCSRLEGE
jgi:hypothetical protein